MHARSNASYTSACMQLDLDQFSQANDHDQEQYDRGSKSLTDEWKTTRKGLVVSGMWIPPTQKGLATGHCPNRGKWSTLRDSGGTGL